MASVLVLTLVVSGCATTRARKSDSSDLQTQVTQLQNDVQAKDQQIQDLQYQIESQQQPISSTSNISGGSRAGVIRVPGVSIKALQRALTQAGFDPGTVDGQMGKKTKSAIRAFQRKNNLKVDGIVGEQTWSLLKA